MGPRQGPLDTLDPARLQALLDLLVESGVEEFEGFGLHVKFTPGLFAPENRVEQTEVVTAERAMRQASSMWELPELWPGGKPPQFPGKPIK